MTKSQHLRIDNIAATGAELSDDELAGLMGGLSGPPERRKPPTTNAIFMGGGSPYDCDVVVSM